MTVEERFAVAAVSPSSLRAFTDDDDDDDGSSPTLGRDDDKLALAADRLSSLVSEIDADFVVVPPSNEVVESAEHGRTLALLSSVAERCGVYLGTTILEADEVRNLEVYSSFVLVGPDGRLVGKVRGTCPLGAEAAGVGAAPAQEQGTAQDEVQGATCAYPHIIPTEYGDVAVAVGYGESLTSVLVDELDDYAAALNEDDGTAKTVALIVQVGGAASLPTASAAAKSNEVEEDALDDASESFALTYACPVVSLDTLRGAMVVGPDGRDLDDESASGWGCVRASVVARRPSSAEQGRCHQGRGNRRRHGSASGRWNPLLPAPTIARATSLTVTTFFAKRRYNLSIRRRTAAAKALGLHYDPHPLLSCYACMLLLSAASASFVLDRWVMEVEEEAELYSCRAYVHSLCRGLCVPFLVLQAAVHAVSHVMHVYVLGDDRRDHHRAGVRRGEDVPSEVHHPSVGCLVGRALDRLAVVTPALKSLGSYRTFRPWGYLVTCLCVGAFTVTTLPMFANWGTDTAGYNSDATESGLDSGDNAASSPGDVFAQYAAALRGFAIPFVLVQVLVNASTRALRAYVMAGHHDDV